MCVDIDNSLYSTYILVYYMYDKLNVVYRSGWAGESDLVCENIECMYSIYVYIVILLILLYVIITIT